MRIIGLYLNENNNMIIDKSLQLLYNLGMTLEIDSGRAGVGLVVTSRLEEVRVVRHIHYVDTYPPTSVACGLGWEPTDVVEECEVTCKNCLRVIESRKRVEAR